MRSRHPLVGQRYDVVDYDTPVIESDTVVPIGYDAGNLQVEQYAKDDTMVVLWNEEEFVRATRNEELREVKP